MIAFRRPLGLVLGLPQVLFGLLLVAIGYGRPTAVHAWLDEYLWPLLDDFTGHATTVWVTIGVMVAAGFVLPLTSGMLGSGLAAMLEKAMPSSPAVAALRQLDLSKRLLLFITEEFWLTTLGLAAGGLATAVMGWLLIPLVGALLFGEWMLPIGEDVDEIVRGWFGLLAFWVSGVQFVAGGMGWLVPDAKGSKKRKRRRPDGASDAEPRRATDGSGDSDSFAARYERGAATLWDQVTEAMIATLGVVIFVAPVACLLVYGLTE